ncbi:Adenylate cyclase [Minicystis rosea]|nr:Adenylate cyclase [Minicystis rosea]
MRVDLEGLGPRFRLESFVARGAWGSVYRGVDTETGAAVAVKRLHDHLCEPSMIARFEREARLLETIDSPHVVRHVAHGRDAEGRPFLALEWLDGRDVGAWRKVARPSLAEVIEVGRQAAIGLAALHDAGIVHRDVKPSNFFLRGGPDGIGLKLIDLGVARVAGESTLTETGFTLGTPAYMSPEQASGQRHPTASSDIFSLGVMLFELITGQKPYRGDDMVSLAMKIVLQDPPRLRDVLPTVSRDLDEVVARAMTKAPEGRFPTARAMAKALAWLTVPDMPVEPASPSNRDASTERLVIEGGTPTTATRAWGGIPLGIERRVVTALFARFEGTAEPAAAVEALREAAERHGGAFHRVLGPQRAAVFGAGPGRGDEALRAARVALAIGGVAGIRLAIVTGRALASEGSLAGGLIDRGLAEVKRSRGEIRIDETTARLLEGRFDVDGGRGERVLRAADPPPDAFGPRLLGRALPMVGRDREAAALFAMFEQCVAEPVARVALVIGPAGTGKSRLRYELIRRAEAAPIRPTILHGRGDAHGAGSPFGMIAPALRRLAGVLDGEPIGVQRRKLWQRVSETALAAQSAGHLDAASLEAWSSRVLSFLGELARVPFPDGADPALAAARRSPMVMNDAMRAAWEDFLAAECAARPVILVLEDLHWGDLPSVTFTDAALRHARAAPLMVLAVARPEVHARFPDLFAGRDLEELRLGALTRRAAEKLVRGALGDDAPEDVVRLVLDRAEGNAFYLEELVRAVSEGDVENLPETVAGMVEARLDALDVEARRVLRAASVFGRVFWVGGVAALLGVDMETVSVALAELQKSEVVSRRREARLPGEVEMSFSHAIVRDAVYATLDDTDRARCHRLAGAWLAVRGAPDAVVLAEHFTRGCAEAEASAWWRRAAEQALEGNDLAHAVERAERGVIAGALGEQLGALRLIQAEAHRFRGELAQAEARAAEAIALLPKGSPAFLRAASELAAAAGLLGHVERVEAVARALPADAPDPRLRSAVLVCLCRAAVPLFWAGHAAADSLFARVDALSDPIATLDPDARALAHFSRATRALHAGRPEEHLLEQRAAEAAFTAGGDARNALGRRVAVGFAEAELGLFAEAEATLRAALTAGERLGVFNITVRAQNNLGHVLGRLGRLDEARAVEERAIEGCVAQGDPRLESASRLYLAEILWLAADRDGAEREARAALALSSTAPGARARALGLLGRILLDAGRAAEALAPAEDAARLLDALGRIDEGESSIRLALAEALAATGDAARAREAITLAATRVHARAATVSDPARRASFLAIPENAETLRLAAGSEDPV